MREHVPTDGWGKLLQEITTEVQFREVGEEGEERHMGDLGGRIKPCDPALTSCTDYTDPGERDRQMNIPWIARLSPLALLAERSTSTRAKLTKASFGN